MGVISSFLVVMSCWVELLDVLSLDFVAEYLILGCNLHSDLVNEEQHISLGSSNGLSILPKDIIQCITIPIFQ
jgi:hypothetical protein